MKDFRSLDSHSKKISKDVNSSGLSQERVCKQCGKGFQSLKALCGHMACHSEKGRVLKEYKCYRKSESSELVDGHFDTEENPSRQTRSKAKRYKKSAVKTFDFGNNNGSSSVCDSEEEDTVDVAACLMMLSRDSRKWSGVSSIVKSLDNQSTDLETKSSSVEMKTPSDDGIYLADEILHLKKLGERKPKSSALVTKSFHASGYLKKAESGISTDELFNNGEYKDAELAKIYDRVKHFSADERKGLKENEFGYVGTSPKLQKFDSKKRSRDRYDSVQGNKNVHSRKKYDCVNCNRSFDSFQALGGHRPCHKKAEPTIQYEYDPIENSLEDDITPISTPIRNLGQRPCDRKAVSRDFSVDAKKKDRAKKYKAHQCPFCSKTFKSGQALGSHKRTHFIYDPEDSGSSPATTRNLIDLNLPAPEEHDEFDDNNQFIYQD
ncbi:Zinc finger protein zat1 [Heracleum sosnowskyi]|uniref:Zinc finger protein zat1 n=1 Tax=Heracleum sosnowskyi TaxID=360622 RepID=A0AAD8IRR4_9APIA|nr:Zinc finger protein zat1 [Heracleum sosnowskyi]